MNNDAFFDILGELDDDIISDAAQITSSASSEKKNIKSLFMIAAAVMVFIISGFIVTENIKTGNMGLYESTAESIFENTTKEEDTLSEVIPTASADITAEPQTTLAASVSDPYVESSENLTAPPQEDVTEETEASESRSELTGTESQSGNAPSDGPLYSFTEVSAAAFLEILPRDSFDTDKYVKSETVSGLIIEDIYGTKVIPDYIPSGSSSGMSVNSLPSDNIKNGEYTVYFTDDSLEVYSSQEFRFLTKSGILTVKASTEPFPLYEEEKLNTGSRSLINDVPVLLLAGRLMDKNAVLDAQFEKDGVHFRVILKGNNLVEEEFIMIIESLI